jgi:hypothetical protein
MDPEGGEKMKILLITTMSAVMVAPTAQADVRLFVRAGHPHRPRVVHLKRPIVVHPPAFRVVVGPKVKVAPGYGRLKVEVEPDRSRVFVDGRDMGKGDAGITLRPGKHTVKVRLPDGRQAKRTVHIAPGRLTTVCLDLD